MQKSEMVLQEKKYYNMMVKLGLSKSTKSIEHIVNSLFKGINFEDKRVLDIGGGTGIYSFYSSVKGAKKVVNLEPFSDGSNKRMLNNFHTLKDGLNANNVNMVNKIFQEFDTSEKWDVIIMHSSVNHLDEEACKDLHRNSENRTKYMNLFRKLYDITNNNGIVIISDSTRYNIWPLLGLKNPLAPSINYEIHQSPKTWKSLLENVGYQVRKICWGASFRRLGKIGKILFNNKTASFFMHGHFDIYVLKNEKE